MGLLRCFTMFIDRHRKDFPGMMPLRKAQTQLAAMGATKLVARMVQAPEPEVFSAVVQFATSLFWGGNGVVQDSLLTHLEADASHSFMRTLSEKLAQSLASMRNWKSELAFVTTTVPELGAQVRQDMLLAKTDVIESKGLPQGCIRRKGTSEAAPEAVRQAVGGGPRSGWRRLLSVTNAIEAGTWRQEDSGWA